MKYFYSSCFFLITVLLFSQQQPKVDFLYAKVSISPLPQKKQIKGQVTYEFDVVDAVDSVFLDAKNMHFQAARLNGKKADFSYDDKTITIKKSFKKGKSYRLMLDYTVNPKQTVYFLGWDDTISGNEQIWTQGQGKYTSYWLPSFDDMNEKVVFDMNINFNANYEVIANGKLVYTEKKPLKDAMRVWSYDMVEPMSSYLLAFAIGSYSKQELTAASGIPIANYYYPNDSAKVEPTYRYTKRIFDFLETEIGVPYPWQNYKQIPVRDFLYSGMENTGATIFSDGFVIDSTAFIDKNYINVNAHELAHQWFGDLVTEVDGHSHWLHEGFATYYAYLAAKEIFGDEYFYWKLYETLLELKALADRGEAQSLNDPKAGSLIFYEKGAWALFMLRSQIGDSAFKKGIQRYLNKYKFKNVTIANFLEEMEAASGEDLSGFTDDWIKNTGIASEAAKRRLAHASSALSLLFEMEKDLKGAADKGFDFLDYWNRFDSNEFKIFVVKNYPNILPDEIVNEVLNSENILLKKALVTTVPDISIYPKEKMEALLHKKSYHIVESALGKLWMAYPDDQKRYLDATKGITGLPNKNVRLLWLTLAILTNDYEGRNTQLYFDELSSYTSPEYSFEIRRGAFEYLKQAFGFTETNLLDLIQASTHHSWRFKKFARDLLDELLKDKVYKDRIMALSGKLNPEEKRYIETKLK
ncbi:M1 family metallopeptidase [uncultured Kriegella sp.]|uniref:M1 family metallopeptidase n=1 Tax=uncultured Kriegella sp. TaxID=1798910 RepID=UPI0030DCF51D|tara:strand:+ start:37419 stop:39506 length:2088 start_codon:yes stop_codon:yes gene_type:complete